MGIPVVYLGHQCGTCGLPGTPLGIPVAYLGRHQWEYLELRQRAYLGVGRHQWECLRPTWDDTSGLPGTTPVGVHGTTPAGYLGAGRHGCEYLWPIRDGTSRSPWNYPSGLHGARRHHLRAASPEDVPELSESTLVWCGSEDSRRSRPVFGSTLLPGIVWIIKATFSLVKVTLRFILLYCPILMRSSRAPS